MLYLFLKLKLVWRKMKYGRNMVEDDLNVKILAFKNRNSTRRAVTIAVDLCHTSVFIYIPILRIS